MLYFDQTSNYFKQRANLSMKWHVVETREEHFSGHASGVSQEQVYCAQRSLLSSQKIVFCFIKIQKNSLVLVVEVIINTKSPVMKC